MDAIQKSIIASMQFIQLCLQNNGSLSAGKGPLTLIS